MQVTNTVIIHTPDETSHCYFTNSQMIYFFTGCAIDTFAGLFCGKYAG